MQREIEIIVVHCSGSDKKKDDSIKRIKLLHTMPESMPVMWGEYFTHGRNWSDIGYQYVITQDGELHKGRPVEKAGAHCKGYNSNSIGICLTGNKSFTIAQFNTLDQLVRQLVIEHNLDPKNVFPHNHFNRHKSCPNFKVKDYSKILGQGFCSKLLQS